MQGTQTSLIKGRNKATDLKKLIQLAFKTEKTQTIQTEPPTSAREEPLISQRSRINKTPQANSLIIQLKQMNIKNGLTTVAIKNKENQCTNKKKKTGLTSSVISLNSPSNTVFKPPKVPPILTSLDFSKIVIPGVSSTTNKKGSNFEFNSEKVRVPPATSRQRSPQSSNTKKQGFKITDFNLGKKLGKGRFGTVRLAQHKLTKFILAIKTINIQQLKESQMQAQLIEQIKLQTFCDHPNILKMYGFFCDSNNIYLLLELGNICLFHELRTEKFYSEQKIAYYIIQVIESLKYIHSENIIHRDIKPQNILLTQGVIKLSDFGWSTYSPSLKRQTFCGTLDYVSPEIVNGDYYDQKVDIWSLGILCYELAVGRAPFQDPSNNQQAIYDNILAGTISFPQTISQSLKNLISKILLKNPQQRLSISQIQSHSWLQKYKTTGRYISKQIWDLWEKIRSKE